MTINAVTKAILLSGEGCSFNNLGACWVDLVAGGGDAYPWVFEGLETGLSGLTIVENNGNTIEWDAGGFARCTANATAICSIQYFPIIDTDQILVQFDMRRHTESQNSKVLKIPSKGAPTYPANVTVGGHGGYQSNEIRIEGYSDRSNGGDSQLYVRMDGVMSSGITRDVPTFATTSTSQVYFPVDGEFHTFKFWAKFNDDNVANGEFAVWLDDVLLLHMTDVWNCATTISDGTNPGVAAADLTEYQYRHYVGVCEYFNNTGFYEDYKNLKIGYTRPSELP